MSGVTVVGKKGRPKKFLGVESVLMYNVLQCLELSKDISAREVLRELEKKHLTPIKDALARAHQSGLATKSWENYRITPKGVDRVLSDRVRLLTAILLEIIDDEEGKALDDATAADLEGILRQLKETVNLIHKRPWPMPDEKGGMIEKLESYWSKIPKEFYPHYVED